MWPFYPETPSPDAHLYFIHELLSWAVLSTRVYSKLVWYDLIIPTWFHTLSQYPVTFMPIIFPDLPTFAFSVRAPQVTPVQTSTQRLHFWHIFFSTTKQKTSQLTYESGMIYEGILNALILTYTTWKPCSLPPSHTGSFAFCHGK